MNWKKYISTEIAVLKSSSVYEFNAEASQAQIDQLKKKLALIELPAELEELYKETDGIEEIIKGYNEGQLIWSIDKVIEKNSYYRSNPDFKDLYMSFDQLLFISDAGNGDLFGFVALNGRFDNVNVFAWNHENDNRT